MITPFRAPRTQLFLACVAMLSAASLTGCADWQAQTARTATEAPGKCESNLTPAENTRLAGIEQMVGDGKFYAALAQLDALSVNSSKAQLIRAEALRRVDRNKDAFDIYQKLTVTCVAGFAHHGLGLIDAQAGRQTESIDQLKQARKLLPTDTRIRNDLGYALLLAGHLDDAQFEFLTALDLSPQDPKATSNIVLLTFMQGQQEKAFELAKKLGLDLPTTNRLQRQALSLSEKSAAAVVSAASDPTP